MSEWKSKVKKVRHEAVQAWIDLGDVEDNTEAILARVAKIDAMKTDPKDQWSIKSGKSTGAGLPKNYDAVVKSFFHIQSHPIKIVKETNKQGVVVNRPKTDDSRFRPESELQSLVDHISFHLSEFLSTHKLKVTKDFKPKPEKED